MSSDLLASYVKFNNRVFISFSRMTPNGLWCCCNDGSCW